VNDPTIQITAQPVIVVTQVPGVGPPGSTATVDAQIDDAMFLHVSDPTPHPAYDDMQDLTVLFENHLI
jgi:hypothetical protein